MSEFATLGAMDFEVLPAEWSDKPRRSKPYEQSDSKKQEVLNMPVENPPKSSPVPN